MKKSIEIFVHIFFWIIFTVFVFMLSKIYLQANPDAPFSQHLLYVVFLELIMGLILFYITFFGIKWVEKKKLSLIIFSFILLVLLVFFALPSMKFGVWQVMSSVIPHLILILLALIFRKFSDTIRLEQEKQFLILQNTKSELALLKMQLSPHFLFNTLNNIDYLVSYDTEKASSSISKLGAILRYMIYDTEAEKIPLSKELKYIEDYIDLLRLRTSGKNYLNYKISGQISNLQIAPMLFMPLVENAYKHSSTKEGENIVDIRIEIVNNKLQFNINNEYDSSLKSQTPEGGLGLNIVKRRLELIYPGRHSFKKFEEQNRYKIELILELDEY